MSESVYLQYRQDTGEILATYCLSPALLTLQDSAYGYVQGNADTRTHYVRAGQLVERPLMPIALEGTRLSGVPLGALISVEHQTVVAEAAEIELDLLPGRYPVKIECWPHQAVEMEVIVSDDTKNNVPA